MFRYHDVKFDHEIYSILFQSFLIILEYKDDRSHYLKSIDQTIQYIDFTAVHTIESHRDFYNLIDFL